MFPTLYTMRTTLGDLPYNTWGLMLTAAFFAAALVVHRRSARVGIDPDKMVGLYIIAIVAGLAGARLLHYLGAQGTEFYDNPLVYFDLSKGGFAVLGGVIGAAVLGVVYGFVRGIPVLKMADVVAPAVILGMSIGRVGCFFAGCCHGAEVELPASAVPLLPEAFTGGQLWFVAGPPFLLEMTTRGVGHNHQVVMATQVYDAVVLGGLFAVLSWLWHRRLFDGQVAGTAMVLYGVWRPFVESLRGDEIRGTDHFGTLTTSQVASIAVLAGGLLLLLLRVRKGVAPETPFAPTEADITRGSAPRL